MKDDGSSTGIMAFSLGGEDHIASGQPKPSEYNHEVRYMYFVLNPTERRTGVPRAFVSACASRLPEKHVEYDRSIQIICTLST